MAKTVLRLKADKTILETGTRQEIDALLSQFENPGEARDTDGKSIKTYLWRRLDDVDVVAVAIEHKLPIEPNDVFEAVCDTVDNLPYGALVRLGDELSDQVVSRLKQFEVAGLDLRAQEGGAGKTLIQRLANAGGFLGSAMEFLESRGLDALARTAGKKSAFERVLAEAAVVEIETLAYEEAPNSDIGELVASVSGHLPLAQVDERELAQRERRVQWLERCVERGAEIPKNWIAKAEKDMNDWMQMAGVGKAWKNRPRAESMLRMRMEAAELRRASGLSGAKNDHQEPIAGSGAEGAEKKTNREAPRI